MEYYLYTLLILKQPQKYSKYKKRLKSLRPDIVLGSELVLDLGQVWRRWDKADKFSSHVNGLPTKECKHRNKSKYLYHLCRS